MTLITRCARPLLASLGSLRALLRANAVAFSGLIKVSRTRKQGSASLTFDQDFGGYEAQLGLAEAAIRRTLHGVHALALGGTAVGTGLNPP